MARSKRDTGTKLRWWIASQLNRIPGQCWTDLVTWALNWRKGEKRTPWSPQDWSCRSDLARNGSCYCGKLRAENGETQ